MMFKRNGLAAAATAVLLATSLAAVDARAQEAQYFPGLQYRSGPFAPSGIPFANGFRDYLAMLNERDGGVNGIRRSEEHTSELQSLMRISYAVFCLKKKTKREHIKLL